MSTQRRHFAGTEKVAILKRHLIDKVPVSDLCDEFDLYPNQFYGWLKEFFENGHAAFDNGRKSKAVADAKDKKIEHLEAKLTRKNEVMAELMEAHTELKKVLGRPKRPLGPPRHPRRTRRFRPLLVGQVRHSRGALPALDRHRR
jgi:transposase-like protein